MAEIIQSEESEASLFVKGRVVKSLKREVETGGFISYMLEFEDGMGIRLRGASGVYVGITIVGAPIDLLGGEHD